MIFNFKTMIPSTSLIPHDYAKEEVLRMVSNELAKKIMEKLEPDVKTTVDLERGFNMFEVCFDTASLDAPIRHGHWIKHDINHECSECHICMAGSIGKYCPNCGAKMDEEKNETD